eukprot:15829072-Heterocapsa_arctica.AAC.1
MPDLLVQVGDVALLLVGCVLYDVEHEPRGAQQRPVVRQQPVALVEQGPGDRRRGAGAACPPEGLRERRLELLLVRR